MASPIIRYEKAPEASGVINVTPMIYDCDEYVEDRRNYQPGGYHPTHIGDVFHNGRYRILHKLGWGAYATVWLARDNEKKTCVAIKIIVACVSGESHESEALHALGQGPSNHPGRLFVLSILDEFFVDGINGRHLCIVTQNAGCSIKECKQDSIPWKFRLEAARSMAAQALLGLEYIHTCGVIHGDLHLGNFLFELDDFGKCTDEEIYERIGEPHKVSVERLDGVPIGPGAPEYCVEPACIFIEVEEVSHPKIIICDFGEAFLAGKEPPKALNTPVRLAPPESFFQEHLGPAVDVWTLACALYEILGDNYLFEGFPIDPDGIIAEIVSAIGPFPQKWWDRWELRSDYFLEDGSWDPNIKRSHQPKSRPLEQRLREMGRGEIPGPFEFSDEELESLDKLFRGMLAYDPTERSTASAAVKSEWMEKWGKPSITERPGITESEVKGLPAETLHQDVLPTSEFAAANSEWMETQANPGITERPGITEDEVKTLPAKTPPQDVSPTSESSQ